LSARGLATNLPDGAHSRLPFPKIMSGSMQGFSRRDALRGLLAALAAPSLIAGRTPAAVAAEAGLAFGPAGPFSFDLLKARAESLSHAAWADPTSTYSAILQRIDFDAYQAISFRKADSLWADAASGAPVELFHLGRYFQAPCAIHAVEAGTAREILYRQEYFDIPPGSPALELPDGIGFAGFRAMAPDLASDWLAFLGASYFRSPSPSGQYGMSARGLAIDTALPTGEEFPRFSAFWLEAEPGTRDALVIYALLESPSVTGAYKFVATKAETIVIDVDMEIWPRKPIARVGYAPLTSMFWYSETERHGDTDWRPEIHDSDGLAIWTGAGERIWRALNDPPRVMTNSFVDASPKGFGLLQRDRNFDHYQDDGVFYDRRPSVWIEPLDAWGKGAVQLVEIPTDDEINDNIVAYWVSDEPLAPGASRQLRYRIHFANDEPYPTAAGRVIATYCGIGGIPGTDRPHGVRKFVVDFYGGDLGSYQRGDGVESKVSASRGEISNVAAYPVVGRPGVFRAMFDLTVGPGDPVDLRLYLSRNAAALTETWLFQYFPAAAEPPQQRAAAAAPTTIASGPAPDRTPAPASDP
jgi:glucans biosynthesis protein